MTRIFGTDGVRGTANEDITAELAVDLAVAAAHILATFGAFDEGRARAIVARDTRPSGHFLSAAVCAGLASAGVDVQDAGVLPTPGLAYLVQSTGADLGVMISASHNPMEDNGIKFLARGGIKLPDEVENAIESRLREDWNRPKGTQVGTITPYPNPVEQYVGHLVQTVPRPLDGLVIVADCANGAAAVTGPLALRAAGATVHVMGDLTDGKQINEECGSTHMDALCARVREVGADAGVAFDGDADRFLAVDANGNVVDGDQIMGILALALKDRGELVDNVLVTTVMSNLGLRLGMREHGVSLNQTAVGDRYVLEEMARGGYSLGGEQSGHVIMSAHATTGDGELTALHVLARMAQTGRSLADLASVVQRLPQVMLNVRGVDKARASIDHEVLDAVEEAERELGDSGRVLLRPSGTEPVVRVMVEAATQEEAQRVADHLAGVVRSRLSL
ncbi:phosphoglucosamine mutase [Devriesea agamarum]|uniref:phosphoglucosamine mutase n=1 Tax=Devriesea agamarum TaxID=472569 RepID=UPI00071E1B49|nr:phosphoglucosamine mutase [Devriesea agamarum]